MNRRLITNSVVAAAVAAALSTPISAGAQLRELEKVLKGETVVGQAIKGLAIAYAVKQSSKQLNSFINTVTLRNKVPHKLATKVVPILSVGERGYVGGAQVIGPKVMVDKVQVVWQYEEGFQRGEFRIKAMVPSADLNPLKLKRVDKVSMGAVIDVDLKNGFQSYTRSAGLTGTRVLRAAAVAGVVIAAAKPLNQFINTVTFNKGVNTKVVPQASFGETAYIGGAQVTGPLSGVNQVKGVFEYWDSFDKGRYRVRVMVPVNGIDPTRIKRVEGVGTVALIDTAILEQHNIVNRSFERSRYRGDDHNPVAYRPGRGGEEDMCNDRDHFRNGRHIWGLHNAESRGKKKGWYKNGKGDDKDKRKRDDADDDDHDRRKSNRLEDQLRNLLNR
jgi:hypothetical protein